MNSDDTTMPVDDQFLKAMGLEGLEGQEKDKALEDILYTLDIQIAKRVAEILSEEQATEFEQLSDESSSEEIAKWLRDNVPDYEKIAEEESQKLKQDVESSVSRVMNQE